MGLCRQEFESLVQQLGLSSKVIFLGIRDDIAKILAAADIFVMSSEFEGLGTSILDAMHSHTAIVATRVGGIPELIEDEMDGLLVEKKAPKQMAEALRRLLSDETLRKQLADKAG